MPFLRCPLNHRVEKNRNQEDVYRIAAGTLAENSRDVPFSALCRVANQQVYVLFGTGISADHPVQSLLWNGVESGRKAQASASGHARTRAPLWRGYAD
jgi:hypothetical protein